MACWSTATADTPKAGRKIWVTVFFFNRFKGVVLVWCLSFIGHLKEIFGMFKFLLVGGFNPPIWKKIARQKWVHLHQIGVIFFKQNELPPPSGPSSWFFWWAPKKSPHAAWSGRILEHQWSGRAAPEIIPKISTGSCVSIGRSKVSKPWGIPPAIVQAENMISFLQLVTAIKAA